MPCRRVLFRWLGIIFNSNINTSYYPICKSNLWLLKPRGMYFNSMITGSLGQFLLRPVLLWRRTISFQFLNSVAAASLRGKTAVSSASQGSSRSSVSLCNAHRPEIKALFLPNPACRGSRLEIIGYGVQPATSTLKLRFPAGFDKLSQ